MSWVKRLRLYYYFSAVMLTVFSSTFLLMPLFGRISENYGKIILVIAGAVFWISCMTGYGLLWLANRLSRNLEGNKGKKFLCFSNIPTCIADVLFGAGFIIFIVSARWSHTKDYAIYVGISVVIFALNLHLLFSRGLYKKIGRVYKVK